MVFSFERPILIIFLLLGVMLCVVSLMMLGRRKRRCNAESIYDDLQRIIWDAGFRYDQDQDIFVSRIDATQREIGYCSFFDKRAALLNMVFDCEPITFEYEGKEWLIELWKGQYGITTGCEIGVYYRDNVQSGKNKCYEAVSDGDMLQMRLRLYKNGRCVFSRSQVHWWLTGFVLGEFSYRRELVAQAAITLKTPEMAHVFWLALIQKGYSPDRVDITGNTVSFVFDRPHTRQRGLRIVKSFMLAMDRVLCWVYGRLTRRYCNTMDALIGLICKWTGAHRWIFRRMRGTNYARRRPRRRL